MPVVTRSQSRRQPTYKNFYIADDSYKKRIDRFYKWIDINYESLNNNKNNTFDTVFVEEYNTDDILLQTLTEDANLLYNNWMSDKRNLFEKQNLLSGSSVINIITLLKIHLKISMTCDTRTKRVHYFETICIPILLKFDFVFKNILSIYDKLLKSISRKMFLFAVESGIKGAFLLFSLYNPHLVTDKCYPILTKTESITYIYDIPDYKDLIEKYSFFLKQF